MSTHTKRPESAGATHDLVRQRQRRRQSDAGRASAHDAPRPPVGETPSAHDATLRNGVTAHHVPLGTHHTSRHPPPAGASLSHTLQNCSRHLHCARPLTLRRHVDSQTPMKDAGLVDPGAWRDLPPPKTRKELGPCGKLKFVRSPQHKNFVHWLSGQGFLVICSGYRSSSKLCRHI